MADRLVAIDIDKPTGERLPALVTQEMTAVAAVAGLPIRYSAPIAVVGVTPTDRAYTPRILTTAYMRVASAPAGSDLVAEVQHWGGASWVTIATLTIPSGSVLEVSASCGDQEQLVGNLVRVNVTSVGSTSAATGVVIDILTF